MEVPDVSPGGPITPERARSDLFILIPKIKAEITRLHSKGFDTEEYKKEIAQIQSMVIQRKYIEALNLAKHCYGRMVK
ncbi:MAG: hypothetical protein ACMUIE_10935 [Thermoplasmatota archaeon]